MFFANVTLRPAAQDILEAPLRLSLWARTFDRFFPWVWAAVVLLFVSGYRVVFVEYGGFQGVGLHVELMHGIAIVMTLIFLHVYFFALQKAAEICSG